MNTKLLLSLSAVVALVAVSATQPAHAEGKHKERKAHMEKRGPMLLSERVAEKLDLTEAQQNQIKQIFEQAKSETKADKESLKSLKKQWRTLSKADALDEQSLLEVANQQAALKAKLQVKRLQTEKAVQLVLNEEQQEKIAKWKKKKQRKARHHGGKDRA
ncbi:Spy/CpxP family protein refolding chaperone [Psychrosphaera haliotis]|nr:Spy/CpxP family protein refolding chaperone [Psychrosphaera haliotis]